MQRSLSIVIQLYTNWMSISKFYYLEMHHDTVQKHTGNAWTEDLFSHYLVLRLYL